MLYVVSKIIEDIKIALDQNQTENSIIAQEDNTLALDEVIRQKILHAARHLLETSDVSVLGEGKSCPIVKMVNGVEQIPTTWADHDIINQLNIYESEEGWGELSMWLLEMPSDYLRLLSLKMSDWKRAVYGTIPFESAEYSQLKSGFAGITGNPERPVVAEAKSSGISIFNTGSPSVTAHTVSFFEIYTSATGDVESFRYCPIPKYENITVSGSTVANGGLEFPERLYRMLVYQAASLVAATYKETALAQTLMNMVYEGEPKEQEEE